MHEDSPPPFIVIRTPAAISQTAKATPYQRGLEIVGLVHEIVESAAARFYLKDRLDRAATGLVFALGRAADAPIGKWKDYRTALGFASDLATLLDILEQQKAIRSDAKERAQARVRELIADISRLAIG